MLPVNNTITKDYSQEQTALTSTHFPKELRFCVLSLLGPEKQSLEMTCRYLWNERRVRLVNNPTASELGKFLSWIIYLNKPKKINSLSPTKDPIKLILPLHIGKRKKCIKKIIEKFPHVETISVQDYNKPDFFNIQRIVHFKTPQIDDFHIQFNCLELSSYLNANDMGQFHIPQTLKKLVISDNNLRLRRFEKKELCEVLLNTGRPIFNSEHFDLFAKISNLPHLEELVITGGCLQHWFFTNGGMLPKTLRHLSLTATDILFEDFIETVMQCPELRSLDVMWNYGMWDVYDYEEIKTLKYLEKFTIAKALTDLLILTLSECSLKTLVIEYTMLTNKWLEDIAVPLLEKLEEIILDSRDQKNPVVKELQSRFPTLKIHFEKFL